MTTPYLGHFGVLLRQFRRAAGLTQEALADQAHVSARGIQDLERGVNKTPRGETVDLLAAALGLSPLECAQLAAAARPHRPPLTHPGSADLPRLRFSGALIPLVGRMRELASLGQFLAGAREPAHSAAMFLLAGEPGIGKTRLLEAVAQEAISTGWYVLAGGCHRGSGQEPYAPVLDALGQHLRVRTPDRLRADLQGCAWLVRLLPELAKALEPLPTGMLPPGQERRLMFAAVARFLANVAGPPGTLLVLDDLQWAGPDALDLLATLIREAAPLRIVGAYRDTEVRPADPLGLLRADLAQAGLVRQQALGPLLPEEAAALLDDLLAGAGDIAKDVKSRVLERAEGVPFVLISYAQTLRSGAEEMVPWNLAEGVRQRVALLPEAAQGVLGAAAILGRRVPRPLLMEVAAQQQEVVLACRARLLLEEGEDAYVFAHDLIQELVEADVGAAPQGGRGAGTRPGRISPGAARLSLRAKRSAGQSRAVSGAGRRSSVGTACPCHGREPLP